MSATVTVIPTTYLATIFDLPKSGSATSIDTLAPVTTTTAADGSEVTAFLEVVGGSSYTLLASSAGFQLLDPSSSLLENCAFTSPGANGVVCNVNNGGNIQLLNAVSPLAIATQTVTGSVTSTVGASTTANPAISAAAQYASISPSASSASSDDNSLSAPSGGSLDNSPGGSRSSGPPPPPKSAIIAVSVILAFLFILGILLSLWIRRKEKREDLEGRGKNDELVIGQKGPGSAGLGVGEFVSERDFKKKGKKGKSGDGMEEFKVEPFRLSVVPWSRSSPNAGAAGTGAGGSNGGV